MLLTFGQVSARHFNRTVCINTYNINIQNIHILSIIIQHSIMNPRARVRNISINHYCKSTRYYYFVSLSNRNKLQEKKLLNIMFIIIIIKLIYDLYFYVNK